MKKKPIRAIFFILAAVFVILPAFLYRHSFSSYFFQDDWFSFGIAKAKNPAEIADFFRPRTDVIYYRPLGMQVPFFLLSFTGLEPQAYRLFTFGVHILNVFLVYLLSKKINGGEKESLFISFLYASSAVFFIPFYWFATIAFMLGPMYIFSGCLIFLKWVESGAVKYLAVSLVLSFFALLTYEMAFSFPLLLYLILHYKGRLREHKKIIPYFFPVLLVGLIRLFNRPPVSGAYELTLSGAVLNNLKAYLLWTFNWPDEMKAQFLSFFMINPDFIRDFGLYFYSFVITFFALFFLGFIYPLAVLKRKLGFRPVIFGLLWFLSSLLTVIFFPKHSFSYYLPVAMTGIFTAMSVNLFRALEKNRRNIRYLFAGLFVLIWVYSSFVSIEFNRKVHWAPRRAQISQQEIQRVKNQPVSSEYSVYGGAETYHALNGQEALRIVLGNENIKTVYGFLTEDENEKTD